MLKQLDQALTFLTHDPLRNIVLLKMLHAHPNVIQCYYQDRPIAGVLLLLPTAASPFDRQTYPTSHYIVLLSTTGAAATQSLLSHIPTDCHLVFKLMDAHDRVAVESQFPLQPITAYQSYTCPAGSPFARSAWVRVADTLDTQCLELYTTWGYSLEEVQAYFASGQAMSFALYQSNAPVSVCYAYCNFGKVWEIGGVFTAPDQRRKGYARMIVETALAVLLRHKRIPRYNVQDSNRPSIQLAETLGMRRFVTIEHFGYEP